MNFLIENKNNANQNSKFLTIIMNYQNSKKKSQLFHYQQKLPKLILKKKSNLPN